MNGLNRQKILGYLAAVFVAGAIAGGAGGYQWGRQSVIRKGPPRPPGDMASHLIESYKREIGLTPEQTAQVEPMIQEASQRVRSLHRENFKQTDAIMKDCNRRIFALLDPSQQTKFRQMEERRDRWFRERNAERDRNRTNNAANGSHTSSPALVLPPGR